MVMGGISGWGAVYWLSYDVFIPLLNFLVIPALSVLIYSRKLERTIWRKYLIVNGFFSVFASWFFLFIAADVKMKIENNVSLYRHVPIYVMTFGITFQAIFFVVWMIFFFRKKELSNRFYKAWGWCFALLYFLPNVIYLTLVTVSFIQRN